MVRGISWIIKDNYYLCGIPGCYKYFLVITVEGDPLLLTVRLSRKAEISNRVSILHFDDSRTDFIVLTGDGELYRVNPPYFTPTLISTSYPIVALGPSSYYISALDTMNQILTISSDSAKIITAASNHVLLVEQYLLLTDLEKQNQWNIASNVKIAGYKIHILRCVSYY